MITVGQRLSQVRVAKNLTLEEIAKTTKIRLSFLTAIEKGEYSKLPSHAYATGFVRNYAEYLGVPLKEIMPHLRREMNEKESVVRVLPEGFSKKGGIKVNAFRVHQAILVACAIFFALFIYMAFQYRYAFFNPPLSISDPKENGSYTTEVVVKGSTDPYATVLVNEMSVVVDKNGDFTKKISVFPGKETIVVVAQNRFGKHTQIQRNIVVLNSD